MYVFCLKRKEHQPVTMSATFLRVDLRLMLGFSLGK